MNLEKLKYYIQTYIDSILINRINRKSLNDVRFIINLTNIKKNKNSDTIHLYLDVNEKRIYDLVGRLWGGPFIESELDITNFLKSLSIYNPLIFHWNKEPNPTDSV